MTIINYSSYAKFEYFNIDAMLEMLLRVSS